MEPTIMQFNHYLNFQGEAEAAFNFYKSVFGGEFAMLKRYGEMPSDGKSQLRSEIFCSSRLSFHSLAHDISAGYQHAFIVC